MALSAGIAHAEPANFSIAPQPLSLAVGAFSEQSGRPVLLKPELADALASKGVNGSLEPEMALAQMLQGTGLSYRKTGDTFLIVKADGPQSGSAAGGGAEVEALIVTAQKREEDIQDVPIAISAFTSKDLQEQKIEGGFDLLKAIPNVTFSKNNFTSYNFSIRGIGTKAVSATTDPGVAVAFNSSGMIVNRLFEQEYFDIERVEVLRGPQGTLYGRNATSGVINVISAKPDLNDFKGWVKGEVGNYNTKRVSAMVNVPILNDKLAVRLSGALTNRDGYGYNAVTKSDVDGRDLWSARLTIGFEPTEKLRGNLIWERFNEDDERARTSKQLCHTDPGPSDLPGAADLQPLGRAMMSQGCMGGSLYDEAAFQAPNGDSLPFVFILKGLGFPVIDDFKDPYGGLTQSTDLREISSKFDPIYRAKADVVELNLEYDLTPSLTVVSQTLYNEDQIYSTQDYNRFNTQDVFATAPNACRFPATHPENDGLGACAGGVFNDPQLGPSGAIIIQDISSGEAKQFSQELRLQSDFEGPLNFSLGANYVDFTTDIDYYVFSNAFNLAAGAVVAGAFFDLNPLDSVTGDGHNYYHSKNPYRLKSTAAFGEVYWNIADALKLTGGLRYTDDRKEFDVWETQLLNGKVCESGTCGSRFQKDREIDQKWGEWTGRLTLDWRPELSFTDQTLLYASYSHGYKAGGANPPNMAPINIGSLPGSQGAIPVPPNILHPATFDPEFVDAFEIGTKNVLFGGGLIFNATAFYYDYEGYQVSQIIDRLALNENYDATVWGLEFESVWSPSSDLRFNANLGYLDTELKDGQSSIDVMNRTYGHEDEWVVLKNWIQFPSNCIVPREFAGDVVAFSRMIGWEGLGYSDPAYEDKGLLWGFFDSPCVGMYSPNPRIYDVFYGNLFSQISGIEYDPFEDTPINRETHNGQGFATPLGGNELPNAPHWTMNVGAQYGFDFLEGWRGTVRADAYWQSQSWARVYNNDPYDKLHGWYNANLSVWIENEDDLKIELYVKNLLDKDPITDAFLNSDDSGLTTNVFVLDPRLIGLSITKGF
ncbi:MAG TPA: TonB-dependent receptor [Caulobacteraceae bacterium]